MLHANRMFTIVALVALILSACQPIVAQPKGTALVQDAAAQKAADQQEFLQFVMDVEQNGQSGDVDRIMEDYADDVLSLLPGRPAMDNAALRADWQAFFDTYTLERTFKLEQYTVAGDYGTRIGSWTNVLTPKAGGDPIVEVGRCVLGFKKVDGAWKIAWEIANTYEPEASE